MNLAFLFPGQGSQTPGMLYEHAKKYKEIRATFKEASSVLHQDLFKLMRDGNEEELNLTVNTQPVMLTASVSIWRVWTSLTGELPDIMSGHSLGEYSALTCANALDFTDAVRVVRKRAELMQKAVPVSQGAMAVILGLEKEQLVNMCNEASEKDTVEAVNFNTETQIVVAGHKAAVGRLLKLARLAKAKRCIPLPISVPAHSSLLEDIAGEFKDFLGSVPIQVPDIPVLHNVNVRVHDTPEEIRTALTQQVHMPVRWLDIIDDMKNRGILHFVEIGPGRVLTGLNRYIDRTMNTFSTDTPSHMEKTLNAVEM